MRKRRVYLGLLILAVGVGVGLLVGGAFRAREPEYGGKKLSEWVEQLMGSAPQSPLFTIQTNEAAKAIQAMGTNAIPQLLSWINYKQPAWKLKFVMIMKRMFHRDVADHKAQRAGYAGRALVILGDQAESAVPDLASWIKDAQSGKNVQAAEVILAALGYKLLSADIALITNSTSPWRIIAIQQVAMMETDARRAVPVLLGLLSDSDARVRGVATNALRHIDREAFEKATGKRSF